jgi:membrane-associated phospholipid phosphatase
MISTNHKAWNIPLLISGLLFTFSLVITWRFPYTHHLWDMADIGTFQFLNHNLEAKPQLQIFAALSNHRLFDLVTASFMFPPIYLYVMKKQGMHFNKHCSHFLAFALYCAVATISIRFFINEVLELHRLSPSHLQDYVIRLSEVFPRLHIRDASASSFPGDHTAVLMLWAGFLWRVGSWRYGIPATMFAALASLPRLIGGAHWLSDDLIGGGIISVILLTWGYGTPLLQILSDILTPLIAKFTKSYFGRKYGMRREWISRDVL